MIKQVVTCDRCGGDCSDVYYTYTLEQIILNPDLIKLKKEIHEIFPERKPDKRKYCLKCKNEIHKVIYANKKGEYND